MTDSITVYQTDPDGKFIGEIILNEGDKNPRTGAFIIPGGSVATRPPEAPEGMAPFWRGGEWVLDDVPGPEHERGMEEDFMVFEPPTMPMQGTEHGGDLKNLFKNFENRLRKIEESVFGDKEAVLDG